MGRSSISDSVKKRIGSSHPNGNNCTQGVEFCPIQSSGFNFETYSYFSTTCTLNNSFSHTTYGSCWIKLESLCWMQRYWSTPPHSTVSPARTIYQPNVWALECRCKGEQSGLMPHADNGEGRAQSRPSFVDVVNGRPQNNNKNLIQQEQEYKWIYGIHGIYFSYNSNKQNNLNHIYQKQN